MSQFFSLWRPEEAYNAALKDPSQPRSSYILSQRRNQVAREELEVLLEGVPSIPKYDGVYIVGARSVPGVVARLAGMARLAGVPTVCAKVPNQGERRLTLAALNSCSLRPGVYTDNVEQWRSSDEAPPEWWPSESNRDSFSQSLCVIYAGSVDVLEHYSDFNFKDVVFYGPKVSCGFLSEDSDPRVCLTEIARDFTDYLGMGCLSPRRYFIHERHRGRFEEDLDVLVDNTFTSGPVKDFLALNTYVANALNVRTAMSRVNAGRTYVDIVPCTTPLTEELFGTVSISYYTDVEEVEDALKDYSHQGLLSTVGTADVTHSLETLTFLRRCPVGEMQNPEFFESHDGVHEWSLLTR